LDCLQKAEVIENDRQFIEMHFFKCWDKENPRSEIDIWSLD
jgi:Holliday junction resolvase RusA-like endonuclease